MAKIEDLIAQIPDERLRKGIAAEVKALKKTKKFGLVFEEHLPETVRLPHSPVKVGELVALKRETGNQLWRVKSISKNVAACDRAIENYPADSERNKEFKISDLVVVRSFGDSIYPALVPVDRVERGGSDKPWHLLINADNFHALQLLLYCYEGITEAALWYEERVAGLGLELMHEVGLAVRRAVETPLLFLLLRRRPEVRRVLTRRFPYRVFFIVRDDAIIVFAVMHAARHDRHWRRRL